MGRLLEFGPFRLDLDRHLLSKDNEIISVPSKALGTLAVLVERAGEVISKEELMDAIWPDSFVEEGNLSQNIHVLRKTLGEATGENRYIATVPGKGYRFVAPVAEVGHPAGIPNYVEPVVERKGWRLSRPRLMALLICLAAFGFSMFKGASRLARSYNDRGVRSQQSGQLQSAIRHYERAVMLAPDYPEAHYNLADAYEEIPDYARAEEHYQRAIDSSPNFYPAYNNLARLYILRLKDPASALRLLDTALRQEPKEESVQYTLYKNYGWANYDLHQLGLAEQNLRHAISIDSNRGSAHCLFAKVLDDQERKNEALREWEACVAFASQAEVEPEWRNEAQERLRTAAR